MNKIVQKEVGVKIFGVVPTLGQSVNLFSAFNHSLFAGRLTTCYSGCNIHDSTAEKAGGQTSSSKEYDDFGLPAEAEDKI